MTQAIERFIPLDVFEAAKKSAEENQRNWELDHLQRLEDVFNFLHKNESDPDKLERYGDEHLFILAKFSDYYPQQRNLFQLMHLGEAQQSESQKAEVEALEPLVDCLDILHFRALEILGKRGWDVDGF